MTTTHHDLPTVLTLTELATILRCSKAHASKLAAGRVKGVPKLPVIRLGRRVIIRRDALLAWLSSRDQGSVVH